MKYQKIYDALQTGGARIDLDQSGWRANSSDNWIAGQRPLWLVAEVPRLHLKMWVTHEFGTLSVTTANSALPSSIALIASRKLSTWMLSMRSPKKRIIAAWEYAPSAP